MASAAQRMRIDPGLGTRSTSEATPAPADAPSPADSSLLSGLVQLGAPFQLLYDSLDKSSRASLALAGCKALTAELYRSAETLHVVGNRIGPEADSEGELCVVLQKGLERFPHVKSIRWEGPLGERAADALCGAIRRLGPQLHALSLCPYAILPYRDGHISQHALWRVLAALALPQEAAVAAAGASEIAAAGAADAAGMQSSAAGPPTSSALTIPTPVSPASMTSSAAHSVSGSARSGLYTSPTDTKPKPVKHAPLDLHIEADLCDLTAAGLLRLRHALIALAPRIRKLDVSKDLPSIPLGMVLCTTQHEALAAAAADQQAMQPPLDGHQQGLLDVWNAHSMDDDVPDSDDCADAALAMQTGMSIGAGTVPPAPNADRHGMHAMRTVHTDHAAAEGERTAALLEAAAAALAPNGMRAEEEMPPLVPILHAAGQLQLIKLADEWAAPLSVLTQLPSSLVDMQLVSNLEREEEEGWPDEDIAPSQDGVPDQNSWQRDASAQLGALGQMVPQLTRLGLTLNCLNADVSALVPQRMVKLLRDACKLTELDLFVTWLHAASKEHAAARLKYVATALRGLKGLQSLTLESSTLACSYLHADADAAWEDVGDMEQAAMLTDLPIQQQCETLRGGLAGCISRLHTLKLEGDWLLPQVYALLQPPAAAAAAPAGGAGQTHGSGQAEQAPAGGQGQLSNPQLRSLQRLKVSLSIPSTLETHLGTRAACAACANPSNVGELIALCPALQHLEIVADPLEAAYFQAENAAAGQQPPAADPQQLVVSAALMNAWCGGLSHAAGRLHSLVLQGALDPLCLESLANALRPCFTLQQIGMYGIPLPTGTDLVQIDAAAVQVVHVLLSMPMLERITFEGCSMGSAVVDALAEGLLQGGASAAKKRAEAAGLEAIYGSSILHGPTPSTAAAAAAAGGGRPASVPAPSPPPYPGQRLRYIAFRDNPGSAHALPLIDAIIASCHLQQFEELDITLPKQEASDSTNGMVPWLVDDAVQSALAERWMRSPHLSRLHASLAVRTSGAPYSQARPYDPSCRVLLPAGQWVVDREGHVLMMEEEMHIRALHAAAAGGHATAVRDLISAGADVHMRDKDQGYTPLHHAALHGHVGAMRVLVDAGAGVNKRAALHGVIPYSVHHGTTPLHLAAMHGHAAAVHMLLHAGAKLQAKDRDGNTPLHHAALHGHTAVVLHLMEADANLCAVNGRKETPHASAPRGGHTQLAALMG